MNHFVLRDSVSSPSKKVIGLNGIGDLPFEQGLKGSLNVLCARIFNMSYANYLRMERDVYGGELRGKEGYIFALFDEKKSKVNDLVKELNRRLDYILRNR